MVSVQMLYIIITILSLMVIGLAISLGVYIQKNIQKEGLCLCRGQGAMQNVDRQEQVRKYNQGQGEYSDFGSVPDWAIAVANPPYSE